MILHDYWKYDRRPFRTHDHSTILTILQHITELLVGDAAVGHAVELDDLLNLGPTELRLLADGQREAAHELVLGDDAAAQLVVVAEELQRAHAVLEDGHANLVEDCLKVEIGAALKVVGKSDVRFNSRCLLLVSLK